MRLVFLVEINRAGYAVIETIPSEVAVSIAAGLNLFKITRYQQKQAARISCTTLGSPASLKTRTLIVKNIDYGIHST